MTVSYGIRQQAEQDLEEIWLYSMQQWGIRQADSYVGSLLSRFSWLAENPYSGKHEMILKRVIIVFQKVGIWFFIS